LLVALYAVIVGLLMVSNIPIFAAKTLGVAIPRTAVLPIFVAVVAFVAALVAHTFEVLTVCSLIYFALIPWSMRRYKALEQADEAQAQAAREARRQAETRSTETAPDAAG
jgi:CDP-diacylglycerol---serine O-phosphatidyltransferase